MTNQLNIPFAKDTRDESYKELVASGKELNQTLRLYDLYHVVGNLTDRAAAEIMGIPEGRVAARRNKLIDDKYPIMDKGTVKDDVTNRNVHLWGLIP